ncbi:hypothetical protein FACS1894141_4850 [Spirochaetia bacterium]|nr:hypothetical protein FACS1894141_4850 [Spirochaetia bacterium]
MDVYNYHKCLLSAAPPHTIINEVNMKLALKYSKCWFARFTTDFDCGFETPWYYIIRDKPIKLEELNSGKRYEIRYGLKNFYIKKIDSDIENIKELYRIYIKASERYNNFISSTESDFIESTINSFEVNVYYGVFYKENNILCGYAAIMEYGDVAAINMMKLDQDYFKLRLSYALVFYIVNLYLDEKHFKYIHNGSRSIRHDTNMQDFLIRELGFKKVYTNLHIIYKSFFGIAVKLCFPFKELIDKLPGILFHNISSMLLQEQIARETGKVFKDHQLKGCYVPNI